MNPILANCQRAWRAFAGLAVPVGRTLAAWAAAQSWSRLIVLSLLALIAQGILIDNVLRWHDDRTVIHHHSGHSRTAAGSSSESDDADVHIGWDGISVTHRPAGAAGQPGTSSTGPAPAATGSGGSAAGPSPSLSPAPAPSPSPAAPPAEERSDEDEVQVHRTLWGWLGDALEGVVLLLIVFLFAAKIVIRQSARSEARAVEAEASAAAAEAQAATAAATAAAAEANAERAALRYQLAQAQLQTLQAQVEPHFLFNTLASVDFLIETDPVRASAMQKNLIRYLRAALPQMRDHGSTLGRESELVRAYLEILKVRMEERLQVVFDIPDGLRSAEFPPMLLQSLVENAIRHGLEPKAEGGELCIRATVEDGALLVQVRDTGVGLATADGTDDEHTAASGPATGDRAGDEAGLADTAPPSGSGVGLRNARERLALLYPGAASCTLAAASPVGTIASIRLPYRVSTHKARTQEGGAA